MMKRIAFAFLAACGGSAFTPTYPDNDPATIQALIARVDGAPTASESAVAVGISASPHRLFALDLSTGEQRWEHAVGTPASAPLIAGELVVLHEDRGVVVYELSTGEERFVVEDDAMFLTGAGGEGRDIAFALSTGGGVGARSKLVVVRSGSLERVLELETTLGAPTSRAGLVFAPWATQNLSVLEAATGEEIARLRITDSSVGHARVVNGKVFFGQLGVFALAAGIESGSTSSAPFAALADGVRPLPGDPAFMRDPYAPTAGPASAIHSIRLDHFPVLQGGEVRFGSNQLYYTFYRLVFALDGTGNARFVHRHSEDIVGAAATEEGLFVADQGGALAFLDAEGRSAWSMQSAILPTAMSIRPGAFRPGAGADVVEARTAQLAAAVTHPDSRLLPARSFALRMLTQETGNDATAYLLGACEDRRSPASLRELACEALSGREVGSEIVVEALARRHDYLGESAAPPVAPLAAAAARIGDASVVPMLLAHLADPATDETTLAGMIEALGSFENAEANAAIHEWVQLYHTEGGSEPMAEALGKALSVVLAAEGEEALEFAEGLAADELAAGAGRTAMSAAIQAWRDAQPAEEGETEEEGNSEGEGEDVETAPSGPPRATTRAVAEQVLEPVRARIRACISADERHAMNARIALVLEGDGRIRALSVIPERLSPCVAPLVRAQPFPGNSRGAREQVTVTIRR